MGWRAVLGGRWDGEDGRQSCQQQGSHLPVARNVPDLQRQAVPRQGSAKAGGFDGMGSWIFLLSALPFLAIDEGRWQQGKERGVPSLCPLLFLLSEFCSSHS